MKTHTITRQVIKAFLVMFLLPTMVLAQEKGNLLSKKEIRKARPSYISLSFGMNSGNFRDFATSPLIYNGFVTTSGASKLRIDDVRESDYGFLFSAGTFSNSFNDHTSASTVKTLSLHYTQLYKLKALNSEKYSVKVGGMVNVTGNLRTNISLQNNAVGVEIIPTIFGSVKVTKNISRKEEKSKRFLFIKYKAKPRTRHISFNLNVGLMNSSYRNGYVYSGKSSVLNNLSLFDDYSFDMFSGFRIKTALDYTVTLANKNKIQLSYMWDAYKTGGDFDKLEFASHIFKLSFLFNTNNK